MSLLDLEALGVRFATPEGPLDAVRDVTLTLSAGERLALVGESGSGKSVTAMAVMGLLPPDGVTVHGRLTFDGQDLTTASSRARRRLRGGRMAMVFQDPLTSLNPYLTAGEQIQEAVRLHRGLRGARARDLVVSLLHEVGMPDPAARARAWPHELSGGQRQRVMIAMALAGEPELLIADEPTTALDVTVQAKILELLVGLCEQRGMALLMITHDLGVVARVAERVAVLYAGRLVEDAPLATLLRSPAHPYTRALLEAVPRLDRPAREGLVAIEGNPPHPRQVPDGCAFAPRCELAIASCREAVPVLEARGPATRVACPVTGAAS